MLFLFLLRDAAQAAKPSVSLVLLFFTLCFLLFGIKGLYNVVDSLANYLISLLVVDTILSISRLLAEFWRWQISNYSLLF